MLSTVPAPRADQVAYDTPITVDFAAEMDASTLTPTNVFLKLDTQRSPITTQYDAAARRLAVTPVAPLQLRRTYTIELGPGVHTADGGGFANGGWFFQFTTNSARRPLSPRPRAGDAGESPYVMTTWDSTEVSAGAITYDLWTGVDSAAIAARVGTRTATITRARWLPTTAWALGQKNYWSVTVINGTTGERLLGPVQSFTTLPLGTPEDSVISKADQAGYNYIIGGVSPIYPYQYCSGDSIASAPGTQGWMTFPLSALPADVHVASARIEVYTYDHYVARVPNTVMTLWSSQHSWPLPCRSSVQYPDWLPVKDQAVAFGRQESGRRLVYMSDLLAAHVEASVRRGGFYGYEFVSSQRLAYVSPRTLDNNSAYFPYLKIHYYRTPPEPAIAKAP